jgi:hypothetical protein
MQGSSSGPPGQNKPSNQYRRNGDGKNTNGISVSGVELNLAELTECDRLASSTQQVDGLHLGSIDIPSYSSDTEIMNLLFPTLPWPSLQNIGTHLLTLPLGDLLADDATELLSAAQPFPGDPSVPLNGWDRENRFLVYRISDTQHIISDNWYANTPDEGYSYVPSTLIDEGRIVQYYHDVRLSRTFGARPWPSQKLHRSAVSNNRLDFQLQRYLNDELGRMNRPSCCGPRFKVERYSHSMAIVDDWLGIEVMTDKNWLMNDRLQFFNWYWKAVMRQLVEIEQMKPRSTEPPLLWDSPNQLFDSVHSDFEFMNGLTVAAVSTHLREGDSTYLQRNAASTRDFT